MVAKHRAGILEATVLGNTLFEWNLLILLEYEGNVRRLHQYTRLGGLNSDRIFRG